MGLKIILNLETIGHILDNLIPINIPKDSTDEKREIFQKWWDDDLKVRSYIFSSLSHDLKR